MNLRRNRRAVILVLGLWAVSAATGPASAHAVIERSDPPANAALRQSPAQVVLRFTEPVDPALSSITVVDRNGKPVSGRTTVSADGRGAAVPLPALGDGVYTVKWRVLSALDGHATSGLFLFAVGLTVQLGAGGTAAPAAPNPIAVAFHWIALAAATVLAGSVVFRVVVLRPVLLAGAAEGNTSEGPEGPEGNPDPGIRATGALHTVAWIAAPLLLVSIFTYLLLQGAEVLDVPVWRVFSSRALWTLLAGTKLGWSVLLQSSLAILILVNASARGRIIQAVGVVLIAGVAALTAVFGGPPVLVRSIRAVYLLLAVPAAILYGFFAGARRPGQGEWIPVVASIGVLGGFTITSHSVGEGVLPIAADWLHVVATAVWIGGLVALVVALGTTDRADREAVAPALTSRFSTVAGVALAALIATGVYSAWVEIPALRAFAVTPYGRTLLVKLVIIVPLVAMGAVNRFVFTPMLKSDRTDVSPLLRTFVRFVGGEIFLAAAVLAVVAVLTITPPARVTLPAPATGEGIDLAGYAGQTRLSLKITPAQPGWNRFAIRADRAGRPIGPDELILLRMTKLDEQLDPVLLRPSPQEAGQYAVEAGEMALPGWWEIGVVVRRAGRQDVSTSFALRLVEPKGAAAPPDPAAEKLAGRARGVARALRTWREVLQLTDGRGGVSLTWLALQAPDRMHYRTADGTESIVIGKARYLRSGTEPWERDAIAEPFVVQGALAYLKEMRRASLGRRMPCGDEICQVVLWEWDPTTAFAALIGTENHRVHQIFMAATAHYMTLTYEDFNGPLRIVAPR
jgi:copper transport protein